MKLSNRETEILELNNIGLTDQQIADKFGLSLRTIHAHTMNFRKKLKAKNIKEALYKARKKGFIKDDFVIGCNCKKLGLEKS